MQQRLSETVLKKLEALTIVDVLRRLGSPDLWEEETVMALTRSQWKSTAFWDWRPVRYDGIFLPGGDVELNLRDNPDLRSLQEESRKEKFLAIVQHHLSWHVPAS